MNYFYADGVDKKGNRFLTSYKKRDQAERYRAGAKITEGQKFFHVGEDGSAKSNREDNGMLLRTLLVNSEVPVMSGNFVVFAKSNGKWSQTQFRYPNYAAANSAVKTALINLFEACAIVEMDDNQPAPTPQLQDEEEDAPF